MGRLTQEQLHGIHSAALELGLGEEQGALLAALPRAFVDSLHATGAPSARPLTTLNALSDAGPLRGGTVPLVAWLKAALQLRTAQAESRVFERALEQLAQTESGAGAPGPNGLPDAPGTGTGTARSRATTTPLSALRCASVWRISSGGSAG